MNYKLLPDTISSPGELPAMLMLEEQNQKAVYDDEAAPSNGNPGHNPTIGYGFNLRNTVDLAFVLNQITVNGSSADEANGGGGTAVINANKATDLIFGVACAGTIFGSTGSDLVMGNGDEFTIWSCKQRIAASRLPIAVRVSHGPGA